MCTTTTAAAAIITSISRRRSHQQRPTLGEIWLVLLVVVASVDHCKWKQICKCTEFVDVPAVVAVAAVRALISSALFAEAFLLAMCHNHLCCRRRGEEIWPKTALAHCRWPL